VGRGLAVLVEALHRGGRVLWDDPDRPRLTAPSTLRDSLLADLDTLRLVLSRAVAFRRHLEGGTDIPVMVLPDRPPGDAGCISCGVDTFAIRCPACSIALWIALGKLPPLSLTERP